jgi:hypothetical protein
MGIKLNGAFDNWLVSISWISQKGNNLGSYNFNEFQEKYLKIWEINEHSLTSETSVEPFPIHELQSHI